jgi:hypothetical protein
MNCKICSGVRFLVSEYKVGTVRAPALECARCHALDLDESLVDTREARDLVRLAQAARAAVCEVILSSGAAPFLAFNRLDERMVRSLLGPDDGPSVPPGFRQ